MSDGTAAEPFAALQRSSTVLLTTFRTGGDAVTTPVSVAVRGPRAYFVTSADSGKAARLRRTDRVQLTPSTMAGSPIGPTVTGQARALHRPAARTLGLLRPTGTLFWSWLLYRVRGHRMTFFEVTPGRDGAWVSATL